MQNINLYNGYEGEIELILTNFSLVASSKALMLKSIVIIYCTNLSNAPDENNWCVFLHRLMTGCIRTFIRAYKNKWHLNDVSKSFRWNLKISVLKHEQEKQWNDIGEQEKKEQE